MADKIITAGSNVMFRHGTQAALDAIRTAKSATSGTFYLTDDSHRLYVGQDGGDAVPVNEGITTVTNIANLPSASKLNAGQFYYISGTGYNILAVSNGKEWIQINSNTDTTYEYAGAMSDIVDGAKITLTMTGTEIGSDVPGEEGVDLPADTYSFTIKSADGNENSGLVITADTTQNIITIDGSNFYHTLSSKMTSQGTPNDIASKFTDGGVAVVQTKSADGVKVTDIEIKGGSNVALTGSDDIITINAKDTTLDSMAIDALDENEKGFKITVTDTSGISVSSTINPSIRYGGKRVDGKLTDYTEDIFGDEEAGVLVLDVYTKTQIDDLQFKLDALHYKGVIGSATALPATPENGDTYKASADFTYNSQPITAGDLLIAQGTKNENGVIENPTWEIVPSGNEDTQYFGNKIHQGVELKERPLGEGMDPEVLVTVLGISVLGDGDTESDPRIEVEESWNENKKTNALTIKHKTYTQDDTTTAKKEQDDFSDLSEAERAEVQQSQLTFSVVDAVTRDAYGHVTGITTKEVHVVDTNATADAMHVEVAESADGAEATITSKYSLKQRNGEIRTSTTDSFKLKVDKENTNLVLDVTAATETTPEVINISMVWGTF